MPMWIFTQHGYISVVQHFSPTPGAELLMRARSFDHLSALLSLVIPQDEADDRILHTRENDYPYRVPVSREFFAKVVGASMAQLDYSNFKNRCAETLGRPDARVLGEIWAETQSFTRNQDQRQVSTLKGQVSPDDEEVSEGQPPRDRP